FNHMIYHRAGKLNLVTDGLSRQGIASVSFITNDQWLDIICEASKKYTIPELFSEMNGLFYTEDDKLYVPPDRFLCLKVIQEYHDTNGIHFGYRKMLSTISHSYH